MFPTVKDQASAGLTTAYTVTTIVGPFMAGVVLATWGYPLLAERPLLLGAGNSVAMDAGPSPAA